MKTKILFALLAAIIAALATQVWFDNRIEPPTARVYYHSMNAKVEVVESYKL